ncbi:ovarian cancer-associated 2 protein [Crotalus adamanteus]|uniref:Esterase OVCA2 n=1 Tax=Crotalus adamanteus TaxID=8729 RepID=A0AAW1CE84_CROAD
MAAPRGGELRLLCLHGYGQSARRFRARTGALRKALRGRAELLYLDAPHRLPAQPGEPEEEEAPRGWWLESGPGPAPEAEPEEALRAVAAALAELGPVDGLLGFSQGAALAGLVCALREGGDGRFPFRFALLVAGFPAGAAAGALRVPSLHVFGQADRVIPEAESRALASRFAQPVLLAHEGGHFVPAAAAQRAAYLAFLRRFEVPGGPELNPPRPPPVPSCASDSAPSPREPGQSPAGAASSLSAAAGGGGEPRTGALQDTDPDSRQSDV